MSWKKKSRSDVFRSCEEEVNIGATCFRCNDYRLKCVYLSSVRRTIRRQFRVRTTRLLPVDLSVLQTESLCEESCRVDERYSTEFNQEKTEFYRRPLSPRDYKINIVQIRVTPATYTCKNLGLCKTVAFSFIRILRTPYLYIGTLIIACGFNCPYKQA